MDDRLDVVDRTAKGARDELFHALAPPTPSFDSVRARARRRRGAVVGGAGVLSLVMVVAISALLVDGDRSSHSRDVVTGPPSTVEEPGAPELRGLAPGEARVMSDSPLAPRIGASSVWTGEVFLVYGGLGEDRTFHADGAAYDPVTDAWRSMPDSPLAGRRDAAAAWTGSEMVVVGGMTDGGGTPVVASDGAAYDPSTGTWRSLASPPDPALGSAAAVEDGTIYAVSGYDGHLLAYDVEGDEWTRIDAPRRLRGLVGVRGPHELIVETWESLMVFDRATGEWQELPPLVPQAARSYAMVGQTIVAVDVLDLQDGVARLDRGDASWQPVAGVPEDPPLGSEIGVSGFGWPVPGVAGPIVTAVDDAVVVYGGGDVAWVLHPELGRWSPMDAGGIGARGLRSGAVAAGDDLVMVWSGQRPLSGANPIGDRTQFHRDGVVIRLPADPWPEDRPYTEFSTLRSRERAQGLDLELGSGLGGWEVGGPTLSVASFAHDNERVLYLAPSVGAVVSGMGPAVVLRLVDAPDEVHQPVHHGIAGFAVSVFVNPGPPHEVVATARGDDHTVRWASVGLGEGDAVTALGAWLDAFAADWESPGWDHAGLQVVDDEDGRVESNRPFVPAWTLSAPDGATYVVRRYSTPEARDMARVAVLAMIAGGRPTPPATDESPALWVFDEAEPPPTVAWFGDDVRWVVEGLTLDDPNLATLVENLLG